MKKSFLFTILAWALTGCAERQADSAPAVLTDRIRFAEAVFPSDGKLLVGSFGSSELDPLNTEGKGYVLEFTDTVSRVLIPSDGNLSAPKGMLVKDSCLLIADVGKLAVYDLRDTAAAPQTSTTWPCMEIRFT